MISMGRLIFYMNLSMLFLLPSIYKYERNPVLKILTFFICVTYIYLYALTSVFVNSIHSECVFPYKNILFNL